MLRRVGVPSPRATTRVARVRSSDAVRSPARARGPPAGCRRSFASSILPDALRIRARASRPHRRPLETRAASDDVKTAGAPGGWFGDARPGRVDSGADASTSAPSVPRRHAAPGAAALGHPQPRAQVHLRVPHSPHPRGTLRRSHAHLPRPLLLRVGRRGARRVSRTTRRRAGGGRVLEKPRAVDSRGDGTGRAQRRRHRLPGVRSRAHLIHPRGISPLHHQRLSTPRRGGVRATRRGRDVGRRRARACGVAVTEAAGAGNQTLTLHTGTIAGDACCLAAAALRRVHRPSRRAYASRLDAAGAQRGEGGGDDGVCLAWVASERAWFGVVGDAPNGGAWGSVLWTTDGAGFAVLWGAVAYSAVGPGALANWLQTRGQAAVPAAEAQLVFATTPVFNAALSIAFLGERAGSDTLVGEPSYSPRPSCPPRSGRRRAVTREGTRTRSGESATRARVSIPQSRSGATRPRVVPHTASRARRHERHGGMPVHEHDRVRVRASRLIFPRLVLVVGSVVSGRRERRVSVATPEGRRVVWRARFSRLVSTRAPSPPLQPPRATRSRQPLGWRPPGRAARRERRRTRMRRGDLEGCPPRSGACRRSRRVLGRPARARRGWSRARRGRRALPRRVADRARRAREAAKRRARIGASRRLRVGAAVISPRSADASEAERSRSSSLCAMTFA